MLPSSLFRPFDTGYRPRSLFDELDYMLPSWDTHRPFQVARPHHHNHVRPKHWTSTVDLHGFRPEEVSTKFDETENSRQVLVHARHEDGDDFAEVKRTVHIPDDVDKDKLQVHLTKEGHLLVKAPFNQLALRRMAEEEDQGLWSEMNKLQRRVSHLFDHGPSALGHSEIVPIEGEGGGEHFRADFAVAGYKPENISVHQHGNRVVVEARQEQSSEDSSSLKHMRREVTIPSGTQVDAMTSQLRQDGILRLEAPYIRPDQPALQGRKIPIDHARAGGDAAETMAMKEN